MALGETAVLAVELKLNGITAYTSGLTAAEAATSRLGTAAGGKLTGALSLASRGVAGLGSSLGHAKNAIGSILTGPLGLIGLGGGLIALEQGLQKSVSGAMSFDQAMELIATQAGGTQQEVDSMTKAILAMAGSVGTAPEALAAGLYHIESAGIRSAKALEVLRVAAEGAKVGNADLESVTNALVAAVNSGIKGTGDMTQAMGALNAIVGAGNMRMQDLTDAMSTGLLSTARAAGISLQSVGAAIADMTNQGVPAVDAATRLRMSISLLAAPTSKAANLFKSIGLGQLTLAQDMRGPQGILGAIADLRTHMQKAGLLDASGNVNKGGFDFLSQAFGGGRSSSAIITLVNSMGKLGDIQAQITKGAGAFGDAWAKTEQEAQFKFEKFQAILSAVGVKVGNVILPMITDAFGTLGDWLDTHQQDVVDFAKGAADMLRGAAGAVMGVAKTAANIWTSIPPELRDILVKGFAADRTIKFLFGFSPVGALVTGIETALSRSVATGLASAGLGKLFVQPVFVTNMGMGGLPGIGGAVAGAGGAATAGGIAETVAALVTGAPLVILGGAVVALAAIALATVGNKGPIAVKGANGTTAYYAPNAGQAGGNPYGNRGGGQAAPYSALLAPPIDPRSGGASEDLRDLKAAVQAQTAQEDASHARLAANSAALAHNAAALGHNSASVLAAARDQEKGWGNFPKIIAGIEKRSAEKYGGKGLGRDAVMATYNRDILRHAERIMKSTSATDVKLARLQALQADIAKNGDPKTRAKLAQEIELLKTRLAAATAKVGSDVKTAVKDQKPPIVNVKTVTNVSYRSNAHAGATSSSYTSVYTGRTGGSRPA